jgi:lysozyme
MAGLTTSPAGRARIEQFEGLRLTAYQDIAGVWTIGYGHTGGVYEGLVWTRRQADAALTDRLSEEFEPAVNRGCDGVPTTQGQFDAMVCLAYNIGVAGFERSEVLKQHRLGNYENAADAFEHWDHVNGRVNDNLHNRRVTEAQVYLDASPGVSDKADTDAAVSDTPYIHNGVVYTPQGGDPVGYGKLAAPGVTTPLAVIVAGWTRWKYGIELTAEMAASIVGLVILALVYVIPHGRK